MVRKGVPKPRRRNDSAGGRSPVRWLSFRSTISRIPPPVESGTLSCPRCSRSRITIGHMSFGCVHRVPCTLQIDLTLLARESGLSRFLFFLLVICDCRQNLLVSTKADSTVHYCPLERAGSSRCVLRTWVRIKLYFWQLRNQFPDSASRVLSMRAMP